MSDTLKQTDALEPVTVFSRGPWLFEETGQRFTGAELDAEAFAKYHAALAAQAEKHAAEIVEIARKLRMAEITLRDREHPASDPRDPPEVLRGLGFWPDCGCGECYAIHCLSAAMDEATALRAQVDALSGALRMVSMLRQLGGLLPGSREVVMAVVEEADAALADSKGQTP